jgi:hypothetical protein
MHARNAKARWIPKGTIKRTAARRWTEFVRYVRHAAQSAKAPETSNAPSTLARALALSLCHGWRESKRAEIAHHEKKLSTVRVWRSGGRSEGRSSGTREGVGKCSRLALAAPYLPSRGPGFEVTPCKIRHKIQSLPPPGHSDLSKKD